MNLARETAFSCRDPWNHAWGEDLAGAQRCLVLSHSGEQGKSSRCGPRLPAFLEAQLLCGFIGDGSRNAYVASLFDGRMAVNGAFLFDDHMAVNRAFLFDGHMAVNGAFVFGGHMTISGAFIPMWKGEPAFFLGLHNCANKKWTP